ncbi:MAG: hypothetical protein ACLR0U_14525 [Enterocloster clostridioformis]
MYPAESVVPESKYLLPGPVRVIRVKAAGPNELHEPAFVSVIIEIKVDGNDFFRQGLVNIRSSHDMNDCMKMPSLCRLAAHLKGDAKSANA